MNIVALLSHSFLLTNLWGKEKRLQGGRQRCKQGEGKPAGWCFLRVSTSSAHLFSGGSLLQTKLKFD